jgi:hypothetical protein
MTRKQIARALDKHRKALADELRPEGCTCFGRGAACDWCSLYCRGMDAVFDFTHQAFREEGE